MNEVEVEGLNELRKIDPFWKNLQYMQLYTKQDKDAETRCKVFFEYERDSKNIHFSRAQNEIKVLARDIGSESMDNFDLEEEIKFEDQLKSKDLKEFGLYTMLKIYHYIEFVHHTRILRMTGEFFKDQNGVVWLRDITRVTYKAVIPKTIKVKPKVIMEQLGKDDPEVIMDSFRHQQRSEAIKMFNKIMEGYYEKLKTSTQLDPIEMYYDERISDETFSKLHPSVPFVISNFLDTKLTYQDIKDLITKDAKVEYKQSPFKARNPPVGKVPKKIHDANEKTEVNLASTAMTENNPLASSQLSTSIKRVNMSMGELIKQSQSSLIMLGDNQHEETSSPTWKPREKRINNDVGATFIKQNSSTFAVKDELPPMKKQLLPEVKHHARSKSVPKLTKSKIDWMKCQPHQIQDFLKRVDFEDQYRSSNVRTLPLLLDV